MTLDEAKRFIEIWHKSKTFAEFCRTMPMDSGLARNISFTFRRNGVDLPKFKPVHPKTQNKFSRQQWTELLVWTEVVKSVHAKKIDLGEQNWFLQFETKKQMDLLARNESSAAWKKYHSGQRQSITLADAYAFWGFNGGKVKKAIADWESVMSGQRKEKKHWKVHSYLLSMFRGVLC